MHAKDTPVRPCETCGNPLKPSQKRYCSLACRHSGVTHQSHTCEQCGVQFAALASTRRKYCSTRCGNAARFKEHQRQCAHCGKSFTPTHRKTQRFCSWECGFAAGGKRGRKPTGWNKPRTCAQCGAIYTPVKTDQRYCSKPCGLIARHARNLAAGKRQPHVELTCQHCGKRFEVFPSHASRIDREVPRYCSNPCKHAAQAKGEAHKRRRKCERQALRRAQKRSKGPIEIIDNREILARDGAICHICGEPIDLTLHGWHRMALTLDHVIPLARGGPHTPDNLKPAHRVCNIRKGASVITEKGGIMP